jgi:hypothetical protein
LILEEEFKYLVLEVLFGKDETVGAGLGCVLPHADDTGFDFINQFRP